jgi:catechol 2,3-dioxygenase-like lactoylglutathione lyase family enzyme
MIMRPTTTRSRARHTGMMAALIGSLIAALGLAGAGRGSAESIAAEAAAKDGRSPVQIEEVLRVGLTVSDLDRSVAFFTQVLDFEKGAETERAGAAVESLTGVFGARVRSARLRLGAEEIELSEYLAPSTGRSVPEDSRANDLWFQHIAIVVSDMESAYAKLRRHRVRHASSGPQRLPDWNPEAGGIEAFYFRDPDGHFLELIAYPPGKGDPRWQAAAGRLFLGIDHTAIAVSDTERSLDYYRDRLGMRIAGTSENHGIEQERLNAVFGARLRITGLRAGPSGGDGGPGIELLEYLAPSTGRPRPRQSRANDLIYWHVDLAVADAAAAHRALRGGDGLLDSPEPARVPGLGIALTAADPDGHRHRLVETRREESARLPRGGTK